MLHEIKRSEKPLNFSAAMRPQPQVNKTSDARGGLNHVFVSDSFIG